MTEKKDVLEKEDKKVIGMLQGYGSLTFADIVNLCFDGSRIKARNRLTRLEALGFIKITGINFFEYTGKEVL